jgi:hypothetical protein
VVGDDAEIVGAEGLEEEDGLALDEFGLPDEDA